MKPYLPLVLLYTGALILLATQTNILGADTNGPTNSVGYPSNVAVSGKSNSEVPVEAGALATAVLPFQSSDDTIQKQGTDLAALLSADLSTNENSIMVERQDLDKILSEQELGASGLVTADSAAKIGSLTGAQVLITGRLFSVGNQYMVVAKIISTETSRVYGVTGTLPDLSKLPQAAGELSGKIDGVLASHRDVLVTQSETLEQRLQRLHALLGKQMLPSITVTITERDYSQPTIDPAAQTEVTKQLQELGFPIIDPDQSHNRADIVITGEAFSEPGARHGNLVSSSGRIELKAVRPGSDQLIWTDSETQIGIDLGDRIAGKNALQKAADKLVERMVPKLVN